MILRVYVPGRVPRTVQVPQPVIAVRLQVAIRTIRSLLIVRRVFFPGRSKIISVAAIGVE